MTVWFLETNHSLPRLFCYFFFKYFMNIEVFFLTISLTFRMKPRSAVILLFAMMLFYEVSAGQKYSSSHARDVTGTRGTT